jgi:ABC-type amino acid transport substrate-binding protein
MGIIATLTVARPVFAVTEITIAGVRGFSEEEAGTVILKEAYRRIGIKLSVKRLPGERALKSANRGTYDGDLQRVDAVKKKFKNLVQVRPAINYLEVSAFSAKHEFAVKGWDSLRPYRIGIIRGMKFADNNTKGMDRVVVGDYEALFKLLKFGRIDIGILPRVNGLFQRIKFGFMRVRELKPPLARIDLFHYLHRRNIALAPRLSAVIENMRDQGELATLRKKATVILLKSAVSRN